MRDAERQIRDMGDEQFIISFIKIKKVPTVAHRKLDCPHCVLQHARFLSATSVKSSSKLLSFFTQMIMVDIFNWLVETIYLFGESACIQFSQATIHRIQSSKYMHLQRFTSQTFLLIQSSFSWGYC
jgi:hypothetical protein